MKYSPGLNSFVGFLCTLDGTKQWSKLYGDTGYDVATGVTTDGSEIFMCGYTRSPTFYGQTGDGLTDAFVMKISSSDGSVVWSQLIGGLIDC